MAFPNKTVRGGVILFLLLAAAWYVHENAVISWPVLPNGSDFSAYYDAAKMILHHQSPYWIEGYIYPPFLAFLLTPLALLSYAAARYVWFFLSQGCLIAAAWLIWRASGRDWIAACAIAFVWAVGGAAPENLGWGQPGSELTLIAAIAMTQRGTGSAVALASGLATKVFPALWALPLLLQRQWRNFLIFAVSAVILVGLPWSFVACCLDGPRAPAGRDTWSGTPSVLSFGVPSVVLRALDPPARNGPLPHDWEAQLPELHLPASHRWSSIAAALATLGIGALVLAGRFRRSSTEKLAGTTEPGAAKPHPVPSCFGGRPGPVPASPSRDSFAVAALVTLSLAVSPVSWHHYQELQYPGFALLLCHALRSRRWGLVAALLMVGACLYQVPVAGIAAYYAKYQSLTVSLPLLYLLTSISACAMLALFGLFVRELREAG